MKHEAQDGRTRKRVAEGETIMNKPTLEGWRRMLEVKLGELASDHRLTGDLAIERVPDPLDESTLEVERSITADALDRKASMLAQVTEALGRISSGNYGVCLACEGPISPKRLAAVPWAALCLECQQAAESGLGVAVAAAVAQQAGETARAAAWSGNDGAQREARMLRRRRAGTARLPPTHRALQG
jgi:DnaK suppressor protein